jgi:tetratricopeptide (TPR) repeat protein
MIGPIALSAGAGAWFAARVPRARRESLRVGGVALILILVVLSNSEARNYRDLKTLWVSTIARNPDCAMCHNNLGNILGIDGRTSEATVEYEEALHLKPDFAEPHVGLGNALASAGRTSEAIAQYEEALRFKPDFAGAHNNLGIALTSAGRISEAIAQFEEALRLKPDYADAHYNLGIALANTGRKLSAIAHFEQALRLKPDLAGGRLPEVIAQLKDAVPLQEPRRRNGPSGEAGGAP